MLFRTCRTLALLLAITSAWTFTAMADEQLIQQPGPQEIWARTELYFGSNRPGGTVSDAEFTRFLNTEITPRFPTGLTLLTAYGQSLNAPGGVEKERSRVLILLYPRSSGDANKRIQEIRERYKVYFRQTSVLRVDSYALVSF